MPKRICYVLPTFAICGGGMVILEHANRLIKRGFDVSLINIGGGDSLDWFPNNCARPYSIRSDFPKNFDIAVVTGWTTAYKGRFLNVEANRWIYLIQSDESRFTPQGSLEAVLARMTYYAPYECLVVAGWMKEWLNRDYGKSAVCIPNALNPAIMYRTEPLAPRTARLRVMIEGPMHTAFKGMDDAFAAVRNLDVEVWCVTNGKPKPGYRCDRLFKRVPYGQMRDIYSSCDVLLKMSKVESFGYPPLEMMACGGTAVITRFTGHEEYAVDGENCFVVDIGNIGTAKEKIKLLSQDRFLLERLKRNALRTAAEKSNWDVSIDILQKYLESPPAPSVRPTVFEQQAFNALALMADKLVIDFHNNSMGTSAACLERLAYLERQLQRIKKLPGMSLAVAVSKSLSKFPWL